MAQYKVAVLDDYQGVAQTKFSKLDGAQFEVTYLPDTLPAYNRPDVSQATKDELVARLRPFHIISTPEFRVFPATTADLYLQVP